MFASKISKIIVSALALFLVNLIILPSLEASALQINFKQDAKVIINCHHQNTLSWGDSDCTTNLSNETHEENQILTPSKEEPKPTTEDPPIIKVDYTTSNKDVNSHHLTNFLLGAFGSVIGTSGIILLSWGVKKLNPTKQVKELKERVENLETIITQDKY